MAVWTAGGGPDRRDKAASVGRITKKHGAALQCDPIRSQRRRRQAEHQRARRPQPAHQERMNEEGRRKKFRILPSASDPPPATVPPAAGPAACPPGCGSGKRRIGNPRSWFLFALRSISVSRSSQREEALIVLKFEPRYLGCYGVLKSRHSLTPFCPRERGNRSGAASALVGARDRGWP